MRSVQLLPRSSTTAWVGYSSRRRWILAISNTLWAQSVPSFELGSRRCGKILMPQSPQSGEWSSNCGPGCWCIWGCSRLCAGMSRICVSARDVRVWCGFPMRNCRFHWRHACPSMLRWLRLSLWDAAIPSLRRTWSMTHCVWPSPGCGGTGNGRRCRSQAPCHLHRVKTAGGTLTVKTEPDGSLSLTAISPLAASRLEEILG